MNSQLDSLLDTASKEFTKQAIDQILPNTYFAKGKAKPVKVTQNQIKNALKKICPTGKSKTLSKDMLDTTSNKSEISHWALNYHIPYILYSKNKIFSKDIFLNTFHLKLG